MRWVYHLGRLVVVVAVLGLVVETGACGLGRSPAAPPAHAGEHIAERDGATGIDVVWVGHATALIRLGDKWVLTDPNFSDRVGLVYERYVEPGMTIDELPSLDAVVISHAHLDHLDVPTLEQLDAPGLLVAPTDAMDYVPDRLELGERVRLDTWKTFERDGLRITAVPASHGAGRYYVDALWQPRSHVGYVIEYGPYTVYFAGDTGYQPEMAREIGRRFDIDVALIPVGPADRPGWVHSIRRSVHASPEEALQIFDDVGAQWMVPIHYGTFFKRSLGEQAAVATAIRNHPRGDHVRRLAIGGAAGFDY